MIAIFSAILLPSPFIQWTAATMRPGVTRQDGQARLERTT